jgi:hypothetical protein
VHGTIYEFEQLPGLASIPPVGRARTRRAIARPAGAAPLVGIIRNPRSHRNKGLEPELHDQPNILTAMPRTRADLVGALAEFAERGIDFLAVDGGDGTVRDVLTCGAGVFGQSWPRLIVLPKGKTNALAVDLGLPNVWSLSEAMAAVQNGKMVERRPLSIEVPGGDLRKVYGFILGAGVFTRATQAAQQAHRWGAFNSFAVALTIAWVLLQSLFGGARNLWRASPARAQAGIDRPAIAAAAGAAAALCRRGAVALASRHAPARRRGDRLGARRPVHSRRGVLPGGPLPAPPGTAPALRRPVNGSLAERVRQALARPATEPVRDFAAHLASEEPRAAAVLFYGSNLRTGSLEGVLDFYLLLDGPAEHGLWPRVSYREWEHGGHTLRAKIATMSLATFVAAARGETRDTTVWARFVQPSTLAWTRDAVRAERVADAVAAAAVTAARLAVVLGPEQGAGEDYWRALFRATYAAEFRVEKSGREDSILANDPQHYAALLPLALEAAGIACEREGDRLRPCLAADERTRLLRRWALWRRWGKPLNLLRLVRAARTFDGAARYAAWKVERHTGVPVPLTPWRERHPVLAAPGVLWRVWRARRQPA